MPLHPYGTRRHVEDGRMADKKVVFIAFA